MSATAKHKTETIDFGDQALKAAQLKDTSGNAVDFADLVTKVNDSSSIEIVTTTNVLTAAESGKTFILNSATGFVTTLPAAEAGLRFKFIVGNTPPTSGNHTVITPSTPDLIDGVVMFNTVVPFANEDTVSFVASTAIAGDWVELVCDGTNWYITGAMATTGAITGTQAD